jgi:hypothetical protein
MPMSWEQYSRMEEEGELNKGVAALEKALKERSEGKNKSCWPLVSFGWKDADLDPEGCCGIKEIVNYNTDEVTVLVGGHKTFCPPENAGDAYSFGECPDCGEPIPEDAMDGTECSNCGHVFVSSPEFPVDMLIADCNCEWTGDEWVASFSVELVIKFEDLDNSVDFDAHHAELIIKKAEEICAPFQKNWAEIDKHLDSLTTDFQGE